MREINICIDGEKVSVAHRPESPKNGEDLNEQQKTFFET